ncbi:MAG TPA: sigma-70 family RNA polymerase sigma factor [Acidimicrobiales bacterium]|nr:sigma-70 family RNA polymerase sigma factor [Acidimicrobiales bacterium]
MAIEERELEDADLVSAAQEGDAEAFAELFRRHYPAVRRICARRFGNLADADEVAQAAFVRAYERIEQCGGERRFGAWVQVIAYRLGADARRHQARAMPTDEPVIGDAALGPNSCEDALLRAERAAEVRQMLATLPPRQREVIVARDLEGRRPGEIAASLGLSLGAVDSLLLRARRRMASAWQAATVEHGAASLQVTTASLAATTMARPSVVRGAVATLGRAIDRASLHLANALGLMPGSGSTAQTLGRLAATGAALAVPAAGILASSPAVVAGPRHAVLAVAPRTVPALAVPGVPARVTTPPVSPAAPAVAVPQSPALPTASQLSLPSVPASATSLPAELPAVLGGTLRATVTAVSGTVTGVTGALGGTVEHVAGVAGQVVPGVSALAGSVTPSAQAAPPPAPAATPPSGPSAPTAPTPATGVLSSLIP